MPARLDFRDWRSGWTCVRNQHHTQGNDRIAFSNLGTSVAQAGALAQTSSLQRDIDRREVAKPEVCVTL